MKSKPEEPRLEFIKFRVNKAELELIDDRAKKAGMRMSNYQRALNQLPALTLGARRGNKNRAKKP